VTLPLSLHAGARARTAMPSGARRPYATRLPGKR
jgi:hypothetical protein